MFSNSRVKQQSAASFIDSKTQVTADLRSDKWTKWVNRVCWILLHNPTKLVLIVHSLSIYFLRVLECGMTTSEFLIWIALTLQSDDAIVPGMTDWVTGCLSYRQF